MKWFYNLRRFVRNLIAGALWGVLFVLACVVGGIYGDNTDNVPIALAVGVVAVFVAAIVFTVFAIIATRRQKQPDGGSNKKTTPPPRSYPQFSNPLTPPKTSPAPDVSNTRRTPQPLPTYPAKIKIVVFERRIADVDVKSGDACIIKFEKNSFMTTENGNAIIDASCYVNGQKIGEFPYGRQLRAAYGNREYNCKIASHQIVDDKHEVYVDIDLPFVVDNKLPLVTNLVGVTFENRQAHIAASVVGDMLSIVHTPTDEYPNTIQVYNTAINACIGVLPNSIDVKLVKKYKTGCEFSGVISSIYGGAGGKNYGIDIVVLTHK